MKYKVINKLNGIVTIVVANNIWSAYKQGRKYFSEPNRTNVPVDVI